MALRVDFDPVFTDNFKSKSGALERFADNTARMTELQDMLYAQDMYSILMVFQAMAATGTDGAIRHVLWSVN